MAKGVYEWSTSYIVTDIGEHPKTGGKKNKKTVTTG